MAGEATWRTRGYLPHVDTLHVPQFVTFRLADSLPQGLYVSLLDEFASLPDQDRKREVYRKVEKYLDEGHGSCLLRNPVCANAVIDVLRLHDGSMFELHYWSLMPNHAHLLLTPLKGHSLSKVMHRIKGSSSREVNSRLGRTGRLWQPEYYDRYIRDESHFHRVAKYIEWNPVKARLCTDPRHWPYSSASTTAAQG